jgi:hypothetical protein
MKMESMGLEASAKKSSLQDLLKQLYKMMAKKEEKAPSVEIEMEPSDDGEEMMAEEDDMEEPKEEDFSIKDIMQEEAMLKQKRKPKNFALFAASMSKSKPMAKFGKK